MVDHKSTIKPKWVSMLNGFGTKRKPCFFLLDFELQNVIVKDLDELENISLDFNGIQKGVNQQSNIFDKEILIKKYPIDYLNYLGQFMTVQQHIKYGNTFLINLTHKTPIQTNFSLQEIYTSTDAKYKMLYDDNFVVFSPECFVKIKDNYIYTYPMKGTINAANHNAREVILADEKEMSEHFTIVDLLRNDLSQVAKNVFVSKFRYIDEIKTNENTLLQVSSEITGQLDPNWHHHLGDILSKLVPAGSISGAPKEKTLQIIKEAELIDRGYYTGVVGLYDGESLDSGVCIRYIENENGQLFFRSGCGITAMSKPELEYQEMIDKIYVPISREYQDRKR